MCKSKGTIWHAIHGKKSYPAGKKRNKTKQKRNKTKHVERKRESERERERERESKTEQYKTKQNQLTCLRSRVAKSARTEVFECSILVDYLNVNANRWNQVCPVWYNF